MKGTEHIEVLRHYTGRNSIDTLISDNRFSILFRIKLILLKIKGIKIYQVT
jgi:hypothetical protein